MKTRELIGCYVRPAPRHKHLLSTCLYKIQGAEEARTAWAGLEIFFTNRYCESKSLKMFWWKQHGGQMLALVQRGGEHGRKSVIFGKYLRRPRSPGITGQDSLGNSRGSRISSMNLWSPKTSQKCQPRQMERNWEAARHSVWMLLAGSGGPLPRLSRSCRHFLTMASSSTYGCITSAVGSTAMSPSPLCPSCLRLTRTIKSPWLPPKKSGPAVPIPRSSIQPHPPSLFCQLSPAADRFWGSGHGHPEDTIALSAYWGNVFINE